MLGSSNRLLYIYVKGHDIKGYIHGPKRYFNNAYDLNKQSTGSTLRHRSLK